MLSSAQLATATAASEESLIIVKTIDATPALRYTRLAQERSRATRLEHDDPVDLAALLRWHREGDRGFRLGDTDPGTATEH